MTAWPSDVIDHLVGAQTRPDIAALRAHRPQARENAQKSFLALFEPSTPGGFVGLERHAVAAFVAGLHRESAAIDFYRANLLRVAGESGVPEAIEIEIGRGQARGPYGAYPDGPLTAENKAGLIYRVGESGQAALGPRLTAALEHAHLLVFRPRDATPTALQALLEVGWTTTDIVTLAQLVAFLSFQIRVIAGLRVLAAAAAQSAAA